MRIRKPFAGMYCLKCLSYMTASFGQASTPEQLPAPTATLPPVHSLTFPRRLPRAPLLLRRRRLLAARLQDPLVQAVGQSAALRGLLPDHAHVLLDPGDIEAQAAAAYVYGVHAGVGLCERGCAGVVAGESWVLFVCGRERWRTGMVVGHWGGWMP
jgi:hypothetical protein